MEKHEFQIVADDRNVYFKMNSSFFLELKDIVEKHPNTYAKILNKKTDLHMHELKAWVDICTPKLNSDKFKLSTKLYWIFNGFTDFKKCAQCQNDILANVQVFGSYGLFCSKSCAFKSDLRTQHIKKTCLEKYGCENPMQNKYVQAKLKKTNLEKFGVEWPFGNKQVKEKISKTILEKYGCKFAMQCDDVKQKLKDSNLKKYGCESTFQREDVKSKSKLTLIKHYGVDHPFKSIKIRQKLKQTSIERYGADNIMKTDVGKKKHEAKMFAKYGFKSAMQVDVFKKKAHENQQKTFIEKYGCHPTQTQEVKNKIVKSYEQTCLKKFGNKTWLHSDAAKKYFLEKYGCIPAQHPEVKKHRAETSMKIYGCENPMQNHDVRLKQQQKYKFQNVAFDSAPELAFYIWLSDNNIKFEYQPNITFEYEFEGKKHFYMPDFLVEDQLVELKGNHFLNEDGTWRNPYDSSQDGLFEAKHQCLIKNNVKILYSDDYKKYLDYIDDKYGKEYLKSFKKI